MFTREPLGDGAFALVKGGSRTLFSELAPGIVLIVASGPGDESLDVEVLEQLSLVIARQGSLTIFADLSKLSGISLGSSRAAVKWVRRNRGAVRAGHLLVGQFAVSMAASMIASVFAGSVRSYSQHALFEAAIRQQVPEFAGLPQ
jgi:hypothetical protein